MDENAPKVKTEHIRVNIETRSCAIIGTVHAPALAYRSRLSDLLNQKDAGFLSVTDASVYHFDNLKEPVYTTHYLAVNLDSIELVRPLDA
ncbi:MAG: hypothetical protein WC828_00710 [Thermoleophilia bacterium]|jgi:hypothetical protein